MSLACYLGSDTQFRPNEVVGQPINLQLVPFFLPEALERYRPTDKLPYMEAFHVVEDHEDVAYAGHGAGWISEVEPLGDSSRHDIVWLSDLINLLHNNADLESDAVRSAAEGYWSGRHHPTHPPVWERIAAKVRVVRCETEGAFKPTLQECSPAPARPRSMRL